MIKTRTVVQVRTHAQKYFATQKKRQQMDGPGGSNMGGGSLCAGLDDSHLMSFSYSAGPYSSTNSLSSSSDIGPRRPPFGGGGLKKGGLGGNNSSSGGSLNNIIKGKNGLSISIPGPRLHRSGSMESSTTSELSLTPRGMRKRTATHHADFFYDDDASGPYTSADDDASDSNTPHSGSTPNNKRRVSPRGSMGDDVAAMLLHSNGVALFDRVAAAAAAAGHLPVDPMAFDADFRADIIASELNIDGMGVLDKLVFTSSARRVVVGDDDTSVENGYSPMSHAESGSSHEDELFMCANEAMVAYPYAGGEGGAGAAADHFPDLDSFIMSA